MRSRSHRRGLLALMFTLAAACRSSAPLLDGPAPPDGGLAEAGADAGVERRVDGEGSCGSAGTVLPAGTVELAWDSGKAASDLRKQSLQITVDGVTYQLAKETLHEAVRFELAHPARIVGFSVRWANLPAGADARTELVAGLYPDFGHNGFDFWAKDPLWVGSRCVKDVKDGEWLTYVLPQPVVVDQPGLVYVAHRSEDSRSPSFAFDDRKGNCDTFVGCHSAINLPKAPNTFNGLSFSFPGNFLSRLHVVYTQQLGPGERIFQKVSGAPSGDHVSFADYDGDGWDDALVGGKLYHNQQGKLVDVSSQAGLPATPATGGVFGDYDNDGCLDLFLFYESTTEPDVLLRSNCDGTFSDLTAKAGIVDQQSYNSCGGDPKNIRSPTAAAAWVDLDADGYLDLYLANFICWGKESYYVDTVFRGKGDGTFEEWTQQHGFSGAATPSRCVAPADFDGDGDLDVFVCNYRLQANLLYVNGGDGAVKESALALGTAGVPCPMTLLTTYFGHTIGAAWGDLDNDGDLDLVAANLAHPRFFHFSDKTQILINKGGTFTDIAGGGGKWSSPISPTGLHYRETHSVPLLGDFDQDGNLDLTITEIYDGRPTDFYWGKGDGTFTLDLYRTGITTTNGWGIAAADVDNDGDLDLLATDLFQNTLPASKKGHWLQVRISGKGISNAAAIGATVSVSAGGKSYLRQVPGGTGKGGQDSLTLHFGLGGAAVVDGITVRFPGKKVVSYAGPIAADQRVWLYPDATVRTGWAAPP